MTMLIRGSAAGGVELNNLSLVDFSSSKTAPVAAVNLAAGDRTVSTVRLDLDEYSGSDSFCELELADGNLVWLRPEELPQSGYFEISAQRDGQVELTPRRTRERGFGEVAVRLLKVFKFKPAEIAGGVARDRLVEYLEREVKAGLFQFGDGPSVLEPVVNSRLSGKQPCLLMLHGTFSSTEGSFGGLHAANAGNPWRNLVTHYGQRMLTLEHRTLSVSPLRNALDVAQALPGGLRLHLLSHSRGGLIGELLSRRDGKAPGFSAAELDVLAELDSTLLTDARELNALLRDKAFSVERFVRVACPARGTILASERGRDWLTVLVNLLARLIKTGSAAALGFMGGAALVPTARMAVDLLQALTLKAIDSREIPGLSAMDPASGFIRGLINSEHARSSDQLAVIAGDSEGAGLVGRLKTFAVDRFFERDNDMVVDTASMIGGARRADAYRYLARGAEVTHFSYFSNARTADLVVKALRAPNLGEVSELNRAEIDQHALRSPLRTPRSRNVTPDLPIVFVLPGIMGTHLKVDGEVVWVDMRELRRGGFARLKVDAKNVDVAYLDGATYQTLADALAADHEVVPFPYDWRLSIDAAAQRLNVAVRERLENATAFNRPIRFVAHSMGGLVVRAMMLLQDSVWPELAKLPDRRFVMLGTPNEGSHAISLLLTGNDKLLKLLALADWKNSLGELVDIAADFPGALDMAPATPERDYFNQQAWMELASAKINPKRWPLPEQIRLDESRAFRERLTQQVLAHAETFYIAGQARNTPVATELVPGGKRPRLRFLSTRQGDGRVPWATGIPSGIKAWYVPAKHGDIPGYKPLHAGLRDILAAGNTKRLSDAPPASRDLPGELFEYPEETVNYLPDEAELVEAAMHSQSEPAPAAEQSLPDIEVRVIWGNLRYAKDPVVVGHYVGDQIVSAEAALDGFLDHALSRRMALGRYPGELGTALVIPNARGRLPGAVVIGLGQVSVRLTRTDLSRAVQAGVSEWAARMLETKQTNETADADQQAVRGLTFVAIGSGSGGLSISEVGTTLLDGVHRALELLFRQRGYEEVQRLGLARIHFLELYEDRAHTLWYGLAGRLAGGGRDSALASCFKLDATSHGVGVGEGGRRRLVLQEMDGWWNPLKITQQGSRLLFENIGDRARAELHGVGTHASQIDRLLIEAVESRRGTNEFSKALFEMLIPNDLKDSLPGGDNVRLLVDDSTARYPWEMILAGKHAGAANSHKAESSLPQSAGLGVIRQFVTDRFRPKPRMSEDAAALVVGDPITHGRFVPLPGAEAEANSVLAVLQEVGFSVPDSVLRETLPIITGLYARPYQIVHLAGHGIENLRDYLLAQRAASEGRQLGNGGDRSNHSAPLDAVELKELMLTIEELDDTPISAMVIGPRQFLTYRNIEQMSQVPELVFINCCHLGKIDQASEPGVGRQPSTAASFAQKFIEIGVRAVVAAGWPVDDAAACTFAETFYREFIGGATFGDAVRSARKQTRDKHPDTNTWTAYQCYGDPSYRLTATRPDGAGSGAFKERYGSPRHLAWEGIHGVNTIEQLRNRVDYAVKQRLDHDGDLCCQIADAFRGFDDFQEAIRWYRKALLDERAAMPLRGVEQLTNLVVRSGQTVASKGKKPTPEWLNQVDNAVDLLERINREFPTQERFSLIGSTYKRKAMALTGAPRLAALKSSAAAYLQAANLAKAHSNPYPFVNAAVMLGAVGWATKAVLPGKEIKGLIVEAQNRIDNRRDLEDFWDFAAPGDLLAAKLFVAAAPATEQITAEAILHFELALKRDRDKSKRASIIDQLTLMVDALVMDEAASNTKRARRIKEAMNKLLEQASKSGD